MPLLKPLYFYLDPGQQGQPYIAPTHECSDIPDDPPAGGGGTNPGGGSGSPGGGGGGGLPVCIFVWHQNVDGNGDPIPGGFWLVANAPCEMP